MADVLLAKMSENPSQVEYHWRLLGSGFSGEALDMLDAAYQELLDRSLIESAKAIVSWFGVPKGLYRITDKGLQYARGQAA